MTAAPESAEKKAVRDFVARFNSGADPWALLSDNVVVTVNGTTPLSGRFPGLELVRGILVDSARVAIESLQVEVRELIGRGRRLAALLAVRGRAASGRPFNEEGRLCSCVFSVSKGRIDEILFYPDTSLIEIALYGRRYVSDD